MSSILLQCLLIGDFLRDIIVRFLTIMDNDTVFVVLPLYTTTVGFKSNSKGVMKEQTFSFI